MKPILIILSVLLLSAAFLQAKKINGDPLVHTFSITAVDKKTGDIGVAVQSHWFSVGSIVSWAEAGVGAVATQSLVNPAFGEQGLKLLREGKTPAEALEIMIKSDEGRDFRQVSVINAAGDVATHTGSKCIADASHIVGENFSVQANMMLNKEVVPAMAEAFRKSTGTLAERLVAALKGAQDAGGDIRGQQSAALLVVRGKPTGQLWKDRKVDLCVEDHPNAVKEIARLLKVHQAYEHMNNGDLAIEEKDEQRALAEYGAAQKMFPENLEMKYWTAVSLVNIGQLEKALPLFKEIFAKDENWKTLTPRLIDNELLIVDDEGLQKILNVLK